MFSSLNMTAHGILRTSLYDMAQSRYNLCCSLLLFLEYLTYLSEEVGVLIFNSRLLLYYYENFFLFLVLSCLLSQTDASSNVW